MVKSLPRVLYHGTRLFIKSVHKTIVQEIELSKEAARVRYIDKAAEETDTEPESMSLSEAIRVLNIQTFNPKEVERNYKYLFEANGKDQSGSFYLQSKVFRAKQRISSELSKPVDVRNDLADFPNK
ncbi:hypothetical protein NQ317_000571 [Molorchus minor]|uniref:Mitochondrial import inner membrane translocase subunit Tim16 n=1 Tax=Molorchus minor TaxID=1323400 RepID=A0ABQ9J0H1_9CUCU|nr:hypothetical protein NQ317_000571 [Molorchus minor]